MKAVALGAVLASAALGAMAACGDSSSGGGAPSSEAGLDAPLFGETGKPDAEQEPGPGDPCGDRSGLQQSAPWPVLGGCPKRAGFADFVGPRNATTKWSVPVDGATSPVVDASRVIWVGTSGGDIVGFSQGGVFQGGAHTGAALKGAAAMNVAGTAILGSTDGFLYGVVRGIAPAPSDAGADGDADTDADAGALSANIVLKQQVAPIASSAVIAHDGTIYLTTDDHIVALAQDGTPKWATPNIGVGASSPALGQDEILYVASTDHNLYALGPTGDVKGAYDAHAPIPGAPVIGGDGTIYVASADGVVHAVDPSLKGKWTYQAGGAVNGLATYAGTVYAASADKKLHAISTVTGKAKWTFETLGSVAPPLVDKEGLVYFGSTDAKLYVLTSGGLLYFAVNAKGPITTAPAISDDSTLYVTTDKALLAIGP